ncbi:MAG: flagellar brake protein, partial [Candidatus Eremiobacterota bacterium]
MFWGKKKPTLRLHPKQEVEVEFETADGEFESHFVQVLDVQKKRIALSSPGSDRRPVRLVPGQQVTVSALVDDRLFSYSASVLDSRDRDFDVQPPKDVNEVEVPPRDDNFRIEVPIQVEYRAMRTAHTQVASTHAITTNGLFLMTNLPIPPNTQLHMELEIPNAPDISAKGRAVASQTDRENTRKHITEVEYEDIPEDNRTAIIRYA